MNMHVHIQFKHNFKDEPKLSNIRMNQSAVIAVVGLMQFNKRFLTLTLNLKVDPWLVLKAKCLAL